MKIKYVMLIITSILLISIISAQSQIYKEPYNDIFTTESRLGKSLSDIKSELSFRSCYNDEHWQSKSCQYAYWCYAILPSTSNNIGSALRRECMDVSEKTGAALVVNDFLPPKGVLYYVVTFLTVVEYNYNDATEKWTPTASIPNNYITADSIRSVCPEGQMLRFDMAAGEYRCYIAKRMCLDTLQTGLCTNVYTLYALDINEDGVVSESEMKDGSALCADRPILGYPQGDGICDMVVDLECVDVCSKYAMNAQGELVCTIPGGNNLCDEWDMAAWYGCWDDVLSPNSKICDSIDSALCSITFQPVCVPKTSGTVIGGQTFPNDCFAKSKGYNACPTGTIEPNCYVDDACYPPIVQCYVPEDCPIPNVCLGGSTAGISAMCLDYSCSYSGACGSLSCNSDADCTQLSLPCVGVTASCEAGYCTIQGRCLVKPEPEKYNIWSLIQEVWLVFWSWIKSLF